MVVKVLAVVVVSISPTWFTLSLRNRTNSFQINLASQPTLYVGALVKLIAPSCLHTFKHTVVTLTLKEIPALIPYGCGPQEQSKETDQHHGREL